jgi:hypothetical protein
MRRLDLASYLWMMSVPAVELVERKSFGGQW